MSARKLEFLVPGDLHTATGGYAYDRRMIAGLRTLGWQVSVHALDADFPQPSPAALEHARELFAALPDQALVLVDGLALGALPQLAQAHRTRLRLLALVHHPLAAETGLAPAVARRLFDSERRALQAVRQVVVTSAATAQALRAYALAAERIRIVEPGTDAAPLARGRRGSGAPGAPGAPGRDTASGDSVHLLCVATVTARKGHGLLIEALAALAGEPWRLTCAGSLSRSPATAERLRSQLQRLNLTAQVDLAGEVDAAALARLFMDADLFVLPSLLEGYGMAVAEALAHGLPVIATQVGAVAELVGGQAGARAGMPAGILVPPGDGPALRRALERVLRDPALFESLRRGAQAVRPTLPRWQDACARMSQVLERAAGAHAGASPPAPGPP